MGKFMDWFTDTGHENRDCVDRGDCHTIDAMAEAFAAGLRAGILTAAANFNNEPEGHVAAYWYRLKADELTKLATN